MINCESIVNKIKNEIKKEINTFKCKPYLSIIQVGDNPASNNYIKGKINDCKEVGIESELIKLSESTSIDEIADIIIRLNKDDNVNGIILQLPLPNHLKAFEDSLTSLISSDKDVDGFNKHSSFVPCTPLGVLTLLDKLNIDLKGKKVTLVGYGKLVNKPLFNLLSDKGCTVTVCRSSTSKEDRDFYCSNSDIIITAAGKRNLITKNSISKNNEQIIIDCGITVENGRQYGDCSEEIYEVIDNCTPRIKGMGLFTRVSLLQNTLKAYKNQIM